MNELSAPKLVEKRKRKITISYISVELHVPMNRDLWNKLWGKLGNSRI